MKHLVLFLLVVCVHVGCGIQLRRVEEIRDRDRDRIDHNDRDSEGGSGGGGGEGRDGVLDKTRHWFSGLTRSVLAVTGSGLHEGMGDQTFMEVMNMKTLRKQAPTSSEPTEVDGSGDVEEDAEGGDPDSSESSQGDGAGTQEDTPQQDDVSGDADAAGDEANTNDQNQGLASKATEWLSSKASALKDRWYGSDKTKSASPTQQNTNDKGDTGKVELSSSLTTTTPQSSSSKSSGGSSTSANSGSSGIFTTSTSKEGSSGTADEGTALANQYGGQALGGPPAILNAESTLESLDDEKPVS